MGPFSPVLAQPRTGFAAPTPSGPATGAGPVRGTRKLTWFTSQYLHGIMRLGVGQAHDANEKGQAPSPVWVSGRWNGSPTTGLFCRSRDPLEHGHTPGLLTKLSFE